MIKRRSVVLIFGEGDSDRAALAELVVAIRPDMSECLFRKLREPPVFLRKQERPATRRRSATNIAKLALAASVTSEIIVVITHQDCDAVEPAHEECIALALSELKAAGLSSVVVAAPAFEIETWWMLFPNELKKVRPLWRQIGFDGENVGLIPNSKERLRQELRPLTAKDRSQCRGYQEYDSIAIAKTIRETGAARRKTNAVSKSFEKFKAALEQVSV